MFYHKDCNLPVALRSEQGEELILVLVVIQSQVPLICQWFVIESIYTAVRELNIVASRILSGRTLSSAHLKLCLTWHFDQRTSTEKKRKKTSPLLTAPVIMASCGGDGRWRMSEENGAGPRVFVGHAAMWIWGIMMQEKRRHCITLRYVKPKNNKQGWNDCWHWKTEHCGALLLMMHTKRDRKLVRWGF